MIEAMAAGTPVIALRAGSVPEVVDDGVAGFVCDDVDGMVAAVDRLAEIDPDACRAQRRRALRRRRHGGRLRGRVPRPHGLTPAPSWPPPSFRRMSANWVATHFSTVLLLDDAHAGCGRARDARPARIVSARVDRVGLLLDVEGVHAEGEGAELLVRAGVLRQDQHAGAPVQDRTLLGDQVHPVADGVDQQRVVVLVGRQRDGEVVLDAQVDRHPVGRAVLGVDVGDDALDALPIEDVLLDVLARGLQQGEEGEALPELGVQLEEAAEGDEAADDVLGRVETVDAQDQVVAAAGAGGPSPPPRARCDSAAARSAEGSIETG